MSEWQYQVVLVDVPRVEHRLRIRLGVGVQLPLRGGRLQVESGRWWRAGHGRPEAHRWRTGRRGLLLLLLGRRKEGPRGRGSSGPQGSGSGPE